MRSTGRRRGRARSYRLCSSSSKPSRYKGCRTQQPPSDGHGSQCWPVPQRRAAASLRLECGPSFNPPGPSPATPTGGQPSHRHAASDAGACSADRDAHRHDRVPRDVAAGPGRSAARAQAGARRGVSPWVGVAWTTADVLTLSAVLAFGACRARARLCHVRAAAHATGAHAMRDESAAHAASLRRAAPQSTVRLRSVPRRSRRGALRAPVRQSSAAQCGPLSKANVPLPR